MDDLNTGNSEWKKLSPPIPKKDPRRLTDPKSSPDNLKTIPAFTCTNEQLLRPNIDRDAYLALELKTPRLNAIHHHLWLAGLPNCARPLHRQKLVGREIFITEDPEEHLVWRETRIFIKPLPDFLLDYSYWENYLCSDEELHKSACGLLLSYAWLVRHKSDLRIAKESGLLSGDIEWSSWVEFLQFFLDRLHPSTLDKVNKRYKYGELRLTRLNEIYRYVPPTYSLNNFVRGFRSGSTWYTAFFERNFKWMLAVFASISVVLSALQLGLATDLLKAKVGFQRASYGFAVASLVAVVGSAGIVFVVWFVLFWYYLLSTMAYNKRIEHRRTNNMHSG
ncbi:hypothetical protein K432DRAFT_338439 [Lepidopterella palustris CBS 459.81]|uniref:Subtilisin-like serine protease n=1 Tax=Lepidopterella palustris CBS 459.81 TaxID=1314670 RepID=A0A8E2DZY8_9PEZI|nr:hypothetical protein K432DRAFT_338439 [Lepidopterella palustris CBS 459.81]